MVKQDTSINEEEFYWTCVFYCWMLEVIFFGSLRIQQVVII